MDCVSRSREVFALEIVELQKVRDRLDESVSQVATLIFHSKQKMVLTGIGKTGIIGKKIAASLASTGTPAVFLNAAEAVHGDLGMICHGDIVLALSNSGSSPEILALLPTLKTLECPLVAMTGNLDSELAQKADYVLDIHVDSEADPIGLAPTASTTAALVMGDALVVCLMEMRNFQTENFGLYHPGGALGRRLLTRVRDRMETNVPRVYEDTSFRDVMYEVSAKRLGMTVVFNAQNQPTGVITDGDVRRATLKFNDILSIVAKDFMTHGFRSITSDAMIRDAMEQMDQNKITTLAVTDDGQTILGILSIHHLFDFRKDLSAELPTDR